MVGALFLVQAAFNQSEGSGHKPQPGPAIFKDLAKIRFISVVRGLNGQVPG